MGMAFQDLIDTVVDQCMKIPIAEKRDDRFGIMMQKVISDEIPVCPPAAKQERSSKNESNPVVEEIPKHEPPEDKADEAVTGENGSANLSSSINGSPIKFEVSSIKEEPNVVPSMTSSTSNYNLQCSTPVSDEPRPSKTLCENINFDSQSNLSSSSHSPVTDSAYYSKHPVSKDFRCLEK